MSATARPAVLVSPLDWGIGHAARIIPIIRLLLEKEVSVILGADKRPLIVLKNEFPDLEFIRLPGYEFRYPAKGSMALKMLAQAPAILNGIRREHEILEKLIQEYGISAVISDNRFGLWSKRIPSVFMTHQVHIHTPPHLRIFSPLINRLNRNFMAKFTECWIPDMPGEPNLSGALSHRKRMNGNYFFIGTLSRFSYPQSEPAGESEFDLLAILSGPEPQRTRIEEILKKEFLASGLRCAMVLGRPELAEPQDPGSPITTYPHLPSQELMQLIRRSKWVISRPGYSTIMDLAALGKRAIFIPTPGQTEQEYLARLLKQRKIHYSVPQRRFDLMAALHESEHYSGITLYNDLKLLEQRIDHLFGLCR